jgi:hypothetical protein
MYGPPTKERGGGGTEGGGGAGKTQRESRLDGLAREMKRPVMRLSDDDN